MVKYADSPERHTALYNREKPAFSGVFFDIEGTFLPAGKGFQSQQA